MKKIIFLFLFFLSFNGLAQVVLEGDRVCMSVPDYNKVRAKVMLCDTIIFQYDSLISFQDSIVDIKDRIIGNLEAKSIIKDSIILQKNETIRIISGETKNKGKFLISPTFWIGCLSGMVGAIILIK